MSLKLPTLHIIRHKIFTLPDFISEISSHYLFKKSCEQEK